MTTPIFESGDIQIPSTTEKCIIFPFDRKKLRYVRDTFRKSQLANKCKHEEIFQMIEEIEENCEHFKHHKRYKTSMKLAMLFALLFIITSCILGTLGLIYSKYKNSHNTYKTGDHNFTIAAVILSSFSLIVLYSIFMVIGYLSNDIDALYTARCNKILVTYRKKFLDLGMRWKIGPKRLWLELWLDFSDEIDSDLDEISSLDLNTNRFEVMEELKTSVEFNELLIKKHRKISSIEMNSEVKKSIISSNDFELNNVNEDFPIEKGVENLNNSKINIKLIKEN